jgi:hypothetical protein
MTIRLSVAARNAAAKAVADLVDAGSGSGIIRIYSGSQPSSPNVAATGTLLATFTLNDPAFGAPGTGTVDLDTAPSLTTTGVAANDAGWFRLLDSAAAAVMDGSVTASGGGGDLIMSTITVSVGLTLQLTAGTITMPVA